MPHDVAARKRAPALGPSATPDRASILQLVPGPTWPTIAPLSPLHPTESLPFPAGVPGMASGGLRRAIHDLRGPLNTLAILHEVMRVSVPATSDRRTEVHATAMRAIGKLSIMLDRLRALAECVPARVAAVSLTETMAAVVARMPANLPVAVTPLGPGTPAAIVLSCGERLAAALETALNCAASALPRGGRIDLEVSEQPQGCRIAMSCSGLEVAADWGPARGKLDSDDAAALDWFRLGCQVEGLAARLLADVPPLQPRLAIDLPRPT